MRKSYIYRCMALCCVVDMLCFLVSTLSKAAAAVDVFCRLCGSGCLVSASTQEVTSGSCSKLALLQPKVQTGHLSLG